MKTKADTIDQYLAGLPPSQRAALQQLRKAIRAAAPKAVECITYRLPGFRQDGMLVAFGARANHCALYLMSSSTLDSFEDSLEDFDTSPGTIRFQPTRPLPAALVKKLVKARIAENASRRTKSAR